MDILDPTVVSVQRHLGAPGARAIRVLDQGKDCNLVVDVINCFFIATRHVEGRDVWESSLYGKAVKCVVE